MKAALHASLLAAMKNEEYAQTMGVLAETFNSYRNRLPQIEGHCSRTLLSTTSNFEVVAMRWESGSRTSIHNHANSRCWVLMLAGSLEVENYDRLDDGNQPTALLRPTGIMQLRGGDLDCRSGPREFHRVKNNAADAAYSLQLYAEPLVTFVAIADENTGRWANVPAAHDAVLYLANV